MRIADNISAVQGSGNIERSQDLRPALQRSSQPSCRMMTPNLSTTIKSTSAAIGLSGGQEARLWYSAKMSGTLGETSALDAGKRR